MFKSSFSENSSEIWMKRERELSSQVPTPFTFTLATVRISGKSTSDRLKAVRSEFLNEIVISGPDPVRVGGGPMAIRSVITEATHSKYSYF